ncbi:nuclear pore complex protein Nup98-Nup96-like [Clytia hemisphaerica]|uniref:nuclear pore complex protein Nup98-Nup96-like n=1 Tax=Clytia hemisphaerica TaxID=252671 RepID=UPI0034D4378D
MKQFIEECLDIALKYTNFDDKEGSNVLNSVTIKSGVEALDAYVETADAFKQIADDSDVGNFKVHSDAWQLAAALWGKQETESDNNLYEIHSARREALSKWLSNVTADQIENEIQTQLQDDGHLSAIFSLLSGRQITKACQVARENKEYRLGFLLAQAGGDHHLKHHLRSQLAQWDENNVDSFMNKDRLKLYVLLSGMMVWKSNKNTINLCQDMDWKRSLAMHLWYYCSSTSTVLDAFTEYQSSFKVSGLLSIYISLCVYSYKKNTENLLERCCQTSAMNPLVTSDYSYKKTLKTY